MNSVIVLVGRILLAAIFILAGFGKLTDISGTAAYFSMYGLPGGSATAVVAGLIELLGGLAILVGFQTRIAGWVMAVFCVATALIAHTEEPLRRVLRHSRHPERVQELLQDDAALTEELAFGIRSHSQADVGLAVRAIPDPTQATQNLSPGRTYIAVDDATGLHTREYNFAGRGLPDLTRITMHALNLVRRTIEGTV